MLNKVSFKSQVAPVRVRQAMPSEFAAIGQLMVNAYSGLEGFPGPEEMPAYYRMLANVGELTEKPGTKLLAAAGPDHRILGAVVFIADVRHYGAPGTTSQQQDAAAFRLLAVDPAARGFGAGKMLTQACIDMARTLGRRQLLIHTTRTMQTAWDMYERLGFQRFGEIDFRVGDLQVYGFRLMLQ